MTSGQESLSCQSLAICGRKEDSRKQARKCAPPIIQTGNAAERL